MPVAEDVRQKVAVTILEQSEDYPAVLAEAQSVRAYPAPFGINAAHVLGYLSPITEGELKTAQKDDDRSVNGASDVGRAGLEKHYDAWLRGMPGYKRVAVDSMGRVLGDDSEVAASPGDTLVTSIDAKVQAVAEKSLHQAMMTARKTFDPVTHRNYVADSGAVVVMDAHNGRVVAMSSQPTYDPKSVGRRHLLQAAQAALLRQGGQPAALPGDPGPVRSGLDLEAAHDGGALSNGFAENTPLDCSSGLQVGNRWFKNYESASYGPIDVRPGAADLLRHVLLPGRAEVLAAVRHRPAQRERQGPAGRRRPRTSASAARPASTSRGSRAAGSPTGTGSCRTGRR